MPAPEYRQHVEATFFRRFGSTWLILGVFMFVLDAMPRWWLYVTIGVFIVFVAMLMKWYTRNKDVMSEKTPRSFLANGSLLPALIGGFSAGVLRSQGQPWYVVGGVWLLGTVAAAAMCFYGAWSTMHPATHPSDAEAE